MTKMKMNSRIVQSITKSSLAYGFGLAIGVLLVVLISRTLSLDWLFSGSAVGRLVLGVLFVFTLMGIGAAIGGYLGGYSLETVGHSKSRWSTAWRSALAMGIGFGAFFFPAFLILSLLSFYTISDIRPVSFALVFAIVGAVFGLLDGVILGLLTVGSKRLFRVVSASIIGFGLGGLGFGFGLWAYIYSISNGQVESGQLHWLILALLTFGGMGGAALGYLYDRLAGETMDDRPLFHPISRPKWRYILPTFFLLLAVALFRPALNQVRQLLTPQNAQLSSVLTSTTIGTHWSRPQAPKSNPLLTNTLSHPDIHSSQGNELVIALSQASASGTVDVFFTPIYKNDSSDMINVSNSPQRSVAPKIASDRSGDRHIVWVEEIDPGAADIFYNRCREGDCEDPIRLSDLSGLACTPQPPADNSINDAPVIAVNQSGELLVVWRNSAGILVYTTWSVDNRPPESPSGCIEASGTASQPSLATSQDGTFALAFTKNETGGGEIQAAKYQNGAWTAPQILGQGIQPKIYIDRNDRTYITWCRDEGIAYWQEDGEAETISRLPCGSAPVMAQDENEAIHILWYADEVENVLGGISTMPVLYEMIENDNTWSVPMIIDRIDSAAQPALASDSNGRLHLIWTAEHGNLFYASQGQYRCHDESLSGISKVVYDIARQSKYRPSSDMIAYCHNRYDNLVYTPNPEPAYSNLPATGNGGFDQLAEVIKNAQYEVLYATMWYDEAVNNDNPGSVLAEAIAELYTSLRENPERYPRGLTVRILLGNPPELGGQQWYVLHDLREAGIDKMVDREIGWELEVADFDGALPHSHTKTLIVDGKTVVAAGFNTTYDHLPGQHVSGLGNNRYDLGIQVTGPIAQDALQVFDDLWTGAHRRHCSDFHPAIDQAWQATCYDLPAKSGHVPEVLRYYLPEGDSIAFSMYRSEKHDEADQQIVNALASAKETIDTIQVNFTLEMICDLNIILDVCTFDNALPYMTSMLAAAEKGARIRVLVKPLPIDGIESAVAIDVFSDILNDRGLSDLVEFRFLVDPMHYKATLIDDNFLIVGSQNFHYSAFGYGLGLTEFSLGVNDPQAILDFKQLFEYHWERADRR